jgi:hypothetical protein
MDQRRTMRRILNSFLVQAAQMAGLQFEPPYRDSEEAIVGSMVLAQRGRDLGLVISDDMVNRVIAQITNNRLRPAELESIITSYSVGGQRVTPQMIFDALREQILANQAGMLFLEGLGMDTPAQRWDHFRRFEQRLKAEILAVPVAEFTEAKEIGKPSEEELRGLFEKHRQQLALPDRPEPGFRRPYRAKFQYFKAGVEELVTAELEKVTEEEIKTYYEKHKDMQFRQSKLSPLSTDETKVEADDAAKEEGAKAGKENGAAKDGEISKETNDKSTKDEQSGDAKREEGTGDDTKADKEQDQADSKQPAKEPAAPDKSADLRQGRLHLVNFQTSQPKKTDASPGAKADSKKPAAVEPSKSAPSAKATNQAAPSATKPSAKASDKTGKTSDAAGKSKPAADDKAEPSQSQNDEKAKDSDTPKSQADSKKADSDKVDGKTEPATDKTKSDQSKEEVKSEDSKEDEKSKPAPIEYKPLDEVRDVVRRAVATDRVREQVDKRMAPLKSAMMRYAELRTRWQIQAATNPDEPPPKPLDMEALASEHGVKAFSTEILSRVDVEGRDGLDIAKSRDMNFRSGTAFEFWGDIVFKPKGLYRPLATAIPGGGDSFLSWKIEESEGHVPEFKDVRDEVLAAWKRIHAREIARKKALEYAKTVRESNQSMKEVFAQDENLPVKEVGPFTWLTRPSVPFGAMQQAPPEVSNVPGVENPGDEFMHTAFNLKTGEVGVAFNHPKSVVYVIRAVEFDPLETVLQSEFMVRMKNYERYQAAGNSEMALAHSQWMQSLNEDYQVRWERTPDMFDEVTE